MRCTYLGVNVCDGFLTNVHKRAKRHVFGLLLQDLQRVFKVIDHTLFCHGKDGRIAVATKWDCRVDVVHLCNRTHERRRGRLVTHGCAPHGNACTQRGIANIEGLVGVVLLSVAVQDGLCCNV